ncbi:MAG TPA: hypothetical protein PKD00_00105 [Burkholderiales bacterium]|nr:hypothetical protein [Burkholderiales bacterium]
MIELIPTENCQCGTCSLYRKINTIKNLDDLLKCKEIYLYLKKGVAGPRIDKAGYLISEKLKQIEIK